MIPWPKRTEEIANLLNPAFCGEIIRRCVQEYCRTNRNNYIDYPLLFLILPIVLHRTTRISMNSRKKMHVWLQENQHVRINFAERTKQLVPVTRETIQFLMGQNALVFSEDGKVIIPKYRRINNKELDNEEIQEIFKKAGVLGKWFATAGTTTTIYTMWGVKP